MQNNENLYLSSDEKMCIVALFYAKLNSNDDRYKGITNKIANAAKILNCNNNTLRNIRDLYDSYFENGRKGWNADLPPKYESVYNEYKNYTIDDLEELVDNILNIEKNVQVESLFFSEDKKSENKTYYNYYASDFFFKDIYISYKQCTILLNLLKNKKNIILQGAPGVGKTFTAKRLAYSLMGEKDESRIELIQFHQNYSYEDFIMGYRPNEDGGFILKPGVFYRFCEKARHDPDRDYFFIIDEINRGNLSKIFGEILMLIEKEYRNENVTLAYRNAKFSVPENLYIIGMMNTADRSLALIDYALRRRFSFFEMSPGFESDGFKAYSDSLKNDTFTELIGQIKKLNKEIEKDSSLGMGFCIGHSYFCNLTAESCTDQRLRSIVEYDIIPMLSEYWFDDKDSFIKWSDNLRGVFND